MEPFGARIAEPHCTGSRPGGPACGPGVWEPLVGHGAADGFGVGGAPWVFVRVSHGGSGRAMSVQQEVAGVPSDLCRGQCTNA